MNLAVFTDIDSELLDDPSFHAMLRKLDESGIPVVPVTSMTLEEVIPIAEKMLLTDVMIVESGGAIARRNGASWEIEACSISADELLDVVAEIEDRSHAHLTVYSVLPGSAPRQFSEPFVIESGEIEDVERAASALGFSIHRGRRLLHLNRRCDEGEAFTRIRRELGCDFAIAIGDAPVDADFLARAELPIVLPDREGDVDTELLAQVPHARVASTGGAGGWVAAVEEFLAGAGVEPRRRAC